MSAFTEEELGYLLGERRLARLATVDKDDTPHVAPVGWRYNPDEKRSTSGTATSREPRSIETL